MAGKIDLEKCHYVNNGVKLDDYYRSIQEDVLPDTDLEDDSFKVVYTGTLRPVNNVDNLLVRQNCCRIIKTSVF